MKKTKYFVFGAYLLLPFFAFFPPAFSQTETITIATYYPSPVGVYRELRSQHMAIGNDYYGASYCWSPQVCANQIGADVGLVVQDRVGIGTPSPRVEFHVKGDPDGNGNGDIAVEDATGGLWTMSARTEGHAWDLHYLISGDTLDGTVNHVPLRVYGPGGQENTLILENGVATVKRFVITPRASNPTDPQDGEIWIIQ